MTDERRWAALFPAVTTLRDSRLCKSPTLRKHIWICTELDFRFFEWSIARLQHNNIVLTSDFNLNLLDVYHSYSVKFYVTEIFRNTFLILFKKPPRVTSKFVSAIDYINTNFPLNLNFKSGIIKTNLLDHFAILWLVGDPKSLLKIKNIQQMYKLSIITQVEIRRILLGRSFSIKRYQ